VKALILAAGYATRLYPLTKEYPKPLLEIKNKPIIDHIIAKINKVSFIDEIFVVTNNKFFNNFKKWSSGKSGKKITLVNDLTKSNKDRLGAIADMHFVIKKKKVTDDLLVIGGDNLFDAPLKGFLDFSKKQKEAVNIGVFKLKNKKDASKYGVVELDNKKKITGFEEKPVRPKSAFVAMCLYYIPKNYLGSIGNYIEKGKGKSDTTGGYIAWLKERADVYGFIFSGSWFDIGDHKYLNAAQEAFA